MRIIPVHGTRRTNSTTRVSSTYPAHGQAEGLEGVKLQGAVKGGPAEQAGIVAGDVVVELVGVPVENTHDFMGALSGLKVGEETSLVVQRNVELVRLSVVLGARE